METNLHNYLQGIADAIKEKKGSNDAINAQDFSDEIKSLPSGASPFAVDFGEEIASGNPNTIYYLQEDIDYYNEIQRKRASGEVTDAQLLADADFKARIAWIPKDFAIAPTTKFENYYRLREIKNDVINVASGWFYNCGSLTYAEVSLAEYPSLAFYNCNALIKVVIDAKKAVSLGNFFTTCGNLRFAFIRGLKTSLSINSSSLLSLESVKYILDNCQDSASSYTLTLHNNVKTAFLAKCDEDAEYAASLAAANAKGLSIA